MPGHSSLSGGGGGGFSTGMIMLWWGVLADIPLGWAHCDGTGITPDLRDYFIVGAGHTYALGETGGEVTHLLTTLEIPAHTHMQSYQRQGLDDEIDCDHPANSGSASLNCLNGPYTYPEGGGLAHENRPPFKALYLIMKV